jgi:hypothetical protein
MEEELLFWSRYNQSIADFGNEQLLQEHGTEDLVSSLVGSGKECRMLDDALFEIVNLLDLDWCGASALTYVTRKLIETQIQSYEASLQKHELEQSLIEELEKNKILRAKVKYIQKTAEDNEWRLQEQVAQMNMLLLTHQNNKENTENFSTPLKASSIHVLSPVPNKK